MEQLNPIEKDGAVEIRRDGDVHYVVMENGTEFTVEGDSCSCGHTRDYTPSRSASFEQSYKKRRQASCKHQVAVLNAEKLGQCPQCGNYQVRENKMNHQGRHVMSEYECAECGEQLNVK